MISDSISFLDVVFCRTTNFINCCLNSSSEIVNVARHGVFARTHSPIGSNALHCCQRYGALANDISIIYSGLINRYFDVVTRMNLYRELVHYLN